MKILSIIDSQKYIDGTPYNRQFQETLKRKYDTTTVELSNLKYNVDDFDEIICSLRLRTLVGNLEKIRRYVGSRAIYVYDQDPWESFATNGPYDGSYYKIKNTLNVKKFVNTSQFWADFCMDRLLPATYVTMGIFPEMCSYGQDWDKREHDCVFMGTVKSHRKIFFDKLKSMGVNIEFPKKVSHSRFLEKVGHCKIFLHNVNDPPFTIDGKKWDMWLGFPWVKDVEIAGSGCYTITNKRGSMHEYQINKIPLIRTFDKLEDIPGIVSDILNKDKETAEVEIKQSVDFIKEFDYWSSVENIFK